MPGDCLSSVVALGKVGVVAPTHEPNVLHGVVAAEAERVPMVEFEPVSLRTPSTAARPRSGIGLRRAHARHAGRPRGCGAGGEVASVSRGPCPGSRPREAPGLEPFELLGDGLLDDRGQIAVRHCAAHQGSESLQLVVELGAGGELHLVPARGQRLDRGGACHRLNAVRTEFDSRLPRCSCSRALG